MTKTTNYQLNQWEKTDRILMEDFNADNAIIDAALGGMRQRSKLLLSAVENETGKRELTLDLSSIDWGQWDQVTIFAWARTTYSSTSKGVILELGGNVWGNLAAVKAGSPMELHLFPRMEKSAMVHGLFFPGGEVRLGNKDYTAISSLTLRADDSYLEPGAFVTVWGE